MSVSIAGLIVMGLSLLALIAVVGVGVGVLIWALTRKRKSNVENAD